MRRLIGPVMVLSLLLVSCRTPAASPTPEPLPAPEPGISRTVVIYLSAEVPVITPPIGVDRVTTMQDLKGLAGHSPRAIWLDTAAAGEVDRLWLVERYTQHWPVFTFGPDAHQTLLSLLGIQGEQPQPGLAAYRQSSQGQAFIQGLWPALPSPAEALRISANLVSEGDVTAEPVRLTEAPAQVRQFAGAMGRVEVAQTLRVGSETYLLISGGWQIESARRELGLVKVRAAKVASATPLGVWRIKADQAPVFVESADPYLPRVVNLHRLSEVPITGPAVLVSPTPGARGGGKFTVTGYVRAFEATFHLRLKDAAGKVLAQTWGTAAAGGPDWGSFASELSYSGEGKGTLEVFTESAQDGSDIILSTVTVEL